MKVSTRARRSSNSVADMRTWTTDTDLAIVELKSKLRVNRRGHRLVRYHVVRLLPNGNQELISTHASRKAAVEAATNLVGDKAAL